MPSILSLKCSRGLWHTQKAKGLDLIQSIVSNLSEMDLPDDAVDKIFSSLVMHEVSDLEAAIREMKRILRPNGKLLILDWEAAEMNEGPPLEVRIPSERLKAIFEEHQFEVQKQMINDGIYALIMSIPGK